MGFVADAHSRDVTAAAAGQSLARRVEAQPGLPVTIGDSISRADVAQFVLAELEDGAYLLSAPTIAATAPL